MRLWLLAGLMVLALGTGAVAQSPSPAATPSSPDGFPSAEPLQIGDFTVQWVPMTGFTAGPEWDDLLASVGKEPDDIEHVDSVTFLPGDDGTPASADSALAMMAFRIEGVPALDITEAFYLAALGLPIDADLTDTSFGAEWFDHDGREVYASNLSTLHAGSAPPPEEWNPEFGVYLYPVGEVLYWVSIPWDLDAAPSLGDILDALPPR